MHGTSIGMNYYNKDKKNFFDRMSDRLKVNEIIYKIKNQISESLNIMEGKNYWEIMKRNLTKAIDKFIYIIALFGPIMTLPQIINVWKNQDVSSLSIRTWWAYLVSPSFRLIYGLLHKEKPLIISQTLRLLANGSIFIWVLLFR